MVAIPKRATPYNLDPAFEAAVVTMAASHPAFYGRIGHALDPELLSEGPPRLVLAACHAIFKESGRGPSSSVTVLQRLRRQVEDGRITVETVKGVAAYFDKAEDAGLPGDDEVVTELAPLLQHRIRDDAVSQAIEAFGKKADLQKVVALEEKAARLGLVDTSVGTVLGEGSFAEMAALAALERLPLGVMELDAQLDGGLQRSGLGVLVGGSGDGKSMALSHIGANSVLSGLHVGYATLELPPAVILARTKANLTGIPINAILGEGAEDAKAALIRLSSRLGRFVVQEFTPHVTTVDDLKEWVMRCEDQASRKLDLLIVDYGDKLTARAKKGDKDQGEYQLGRVVFEALRIFAVEKKLFSWTASQASRQKDRKRKKLDLNDVADSMHKIRVADLVITLNLDTSDPENQEMTFHIAKHRTGKSRVSVGPLPVQYELGRIAPAMTSEDDWGL